MKDKFCLHLRNFFNDSEIARFENQFKKIALSEINKNLNASSITNDSFVIISSIYIEHYKELILNILWLISEGELSYLKHLTRKICIDSMEFLTEPTKFTKLLENYIYSFSSTSKDQEHLKLTKIDWQKFHRNESLFLYRETFNLIVSKDQHFKSIIKSLTSIAIQQMNNQEFGKEVA